MPNKATSKKNLRKSQRRRLINMPIYTQIKNVRKRISSLAKTAVQSGEFKESDSFLASIASLFGKLHSKSRKNNTLKLRASRFQSKVVQFVKKRFPQA